MSRSRQNGIACGRAPPFHKTRAAGAPPPLGSAARSLQGAKGKLMDDLTRRQILRGTAAALSAAALPAAAVAEEAKPADGDWIELETAIKETILDGHRVRLRAYNGQIPGPTITIVPGQTLRIRLKNSLPPYNSSQWNGDHNVPHGFDATNLHVHGLDVIPHIFEPIGTSDPMAPQIVVGPGETKDYVFEIPPDHPPGFDFYHPHKHGSTAVQLVSGLAGGLIVRGAIDEVPEIKAAREIPLVVQDIGLFPSETDPDLWTYEPVQNAVWQTFGGYVTIKGERTNLRGGFSTGDYRLRYYLLNGEPFYKETHNDDPEKAIEPIGTQLPVQRFTLAPGEVVRFRMLNGNSDLMMPIVVDGHDVHQIAMDGTNFTSVRTIPARSPDDTSEQMLLASANRSDFLIKGNATPGIYKIRQLAQKAQFLVSEEKVIAEIEVAGPAEGHGAARQAANSVTRVSPDRALRDQAYPRHRIHRQYARTHQHDRRRRLPDQQRDLRRAGSADRRQPE